MSIPTKATIAFNDGVEHELPVAPGQSVLDAALAVEAPILYQCGTGSCGSCIAHLDHGDADHMAGASASLLPSERAEGYRLLCITEARGDRPATSQRRSRPRSASSGDPRSLRRVAPGASSRSR